MRIAIGDLWVIEADFKGIPTNGCRNKQGRAIMGKGVAAQAKSRYPELPHILGAALNTGGNRIHLLSWNLFSFPTKDDWREPSKPGLIRQSVLELKELALRLSDSTFAVPMPGVGAGGLSLSVVWPLLQDLPDNVIVVVQDKELLPNDTPL